jgi:hypothetical protein
MGDDLSLRDELIQAAGMETDAKIPDAPKDEPAAAPEKAAKEAPQEQDRPSGERERGPDGKFVKKQADEEQPELNLEQKDTPADAKQDAPEEIPTPKMPRAWSAEYKAKFLTLPEDVQSYILQREKEAESIIGKKGGEAGTAQKQLTEFNSVLEPYRSKIAMRGTSEAQHIASLLKAEEQLETNPYQAFQYLARSYGVDLTRFTQQQAAAPQISPELQPLVGELSQMKQYLLQQSQQTEQRAIAAAQAEIEAFAAQAEHFKDVETDLVPLVAQIKAQNPNIGHREAIQQAYDKAVWANPHTRAIEIAKQEATKEAQRKAEQAKAAKEAQRKNVGLSGAPAGMPAASSNDSLRGMIESAMRASRA